MAGHAAGDRVDAVQHLDAALLEHGGEVGDRALGLGDRHPVARARPPRAARTRAGSRRRRRSWSARCRPPPRRRSRAGPPAPRPPKKTLPIERFMASAIWRVRIEPDAPTSMPPTISAVLSSARPAAAADSPVKAFSVEITTGMSAPPIGSTASTPSAPAASSISQNSNSDSVPAAMTTASATAATASAPLTACGMRKRPLERLLQLQERDVRAPERDRADDRGEQDRDQLLELGVAAHLERLAVLDHADQRHRAAADAVEQRHHLRHRGHLHVACRRDPDRRADRDPTAISGQSPIRRRAASRRPRSPCPTAATRFPRTAVRGPRAGRSPTMKSAKATM